MNNQFHTRQEIATLFRVSVYTIDNWIKRGNLSSFKVAGTVRISNDDIAKFVEIKSNKQYE